MVPKTVLLEEFLYLLLRNYGNCSKYLKVIFLFPKNTIGFPRSFTSIYHKNYKVSLWITVISCKHLQLMIFWFRPFSEHLWISFLDTKSAMPFRNNVSIFVNGICIDHDFLYWLIVCRVTGPLVRQVGISMITHGSLKPE